MISKLVSTGLAALTAALVGVNAQAASPDLDAASVRVSLADLNLTGQPGAMVALQRIHSAAVSVCGPAPNIVDLQRVAIYRACVPAAVERAVSSINSPVVTALYADGGRRSSELASR